MPRTHRKPQQVVDITAKVAVLYRAGVAPSDIARIAGNSRSYIWRLLQQAGVCTAKHNPAFPDLPCGTRVTIKCAFCGRESQRTRSQARGRMDMYCNEECYWADLENPKFIEWRHGKRIARSRVKPHFDLQKEHVVHHLDGDERNNDVHNLAVFRSQADHMAFHRGRKVAPIWDGRSLV